MNGPMMDTVTVASMDSYTEGGVDKLSIHGWSMDEHSKCGIHGYLDRGGYARCLSMDCPWNTISVASLDT